LQKHVYSKSNVKINCQKAGKIGGVRGRRKEGNQNWANQMVLVKKVKRVPVVKSKLFNSRYLRPYLAVQSASFGLEQFYQDN
jgi:hypothetical protein